MFHVKHKAERHKSMFDSSAIFQRSHTGREEIHQKSHGLTQSERLVLIMIDGVSTYQQLRGKLPVLSDERFERALQKLHKKELALEVLMPLDDQAPEELERTVIDRFLQQDPLDPLTIIVRDPEDELDYMLASSSQQPALQPASVPEAYPEPVPILESAPNPADATVPPCDIPVLEQPPSPAVREPAMDAFHNALADSLAQEVRARQPERIAKVDRMVSPQFGVNAPVAETSDDSLLAPVRSVHWGYWLIAVGIGFLAGYILAKVGA
jgi:hypothetical protein